MININYYTGIGSRKTPQPILGLMTQIAKQLYLQGWVLRSGHAEGADRAFETGAQGRSIIYVPWHTFGERSYGNVPGLRVWGQKVCIRSLWKDNFDTLVEMGIVSPYVTNGAKLLLGRNYSQVVGHGPKPESSKFLIGYAKVDKNGNEQGGSRIAFEVARAFGVPTFNLALPTGLKSLLEHLSKNGANTTELPSRTGLNSSSQGNKTEQKHANLRSLCDKRSI